jgi:tetratricopeptide (TPR) repeat protein
MEPTTLVRSMVLACAVAGLALWTPEVTPNLRAQAAATKIPITSSSQEARALYVKGRDLTERLRATDGRPFFQQAVAKDERFALGFVGLATTAGTNKEFVDAVTRAAALVQGVSDGERHLILGLEAIMKGNPAGQEQHYLEMVRLYPGDERAHTLLGNVYFGRQDYRKAVQSYDKAIAIAPAFSAPYNQAGYAYRFLEDYEQSERIFRKYTELIPDDPNPYDSYAELLMKVGRFDESIAAYRKALSIDPNFVASYIGIGNNQLAGGRPAEARESFKALAGVARTTGERRQAHFWMAASHAHEGAVDRAIGELTKELELARAEGDGGAMAGDLVQMGDVLREAGRHTEALAKYDEALTTIQAAAVPVEVKEAARRNRIYKRGLVAVAGGDLPTARARNAEYSTQVAVRNVPFEVRQGHELAGAIALAAKDYAGALRELALANQQDPRVLYLAALAHRGAGDAREAQRFASKAGHFNGLSFNYAFVRTKALAMIGS